MTDLGKTGYIESADNNYPGMGLSRNTGKERCLPGIFLSGHWVIQECGVSGNPAEGPYRIELGLSKIRFSCNSDFPPLSGQGQFGSFAINVWFIGLRFPKLQLSTSDLQSFFYEG